MAVGYDVGRVWISYLGADYVCCVVGSAWCVVLQLVPGLGSMLPGLQVLFDSEEDLTEYLEEDGTEAVQDKFESVCENLLAALEVEGPDASAESETVNKWKVCISLNVHLNPYLAIHTALLIDNAYLCIS